MIPASGSIVRNGTALDRFAGIDRVVRATKRTRQHSGDHQVRFGVGPCDSVLDSGSGRVAVR